MNVHSSTIYNSEKVEMTQMSIDQRMDKKMSYVGLPGGTVVKNPPANAGDTGSGPDLGRSHMPRSN